MSSLNIIQDCGKGLNAANKNERALMFQVRNGPVCYNFDNNTLGVVSRLNLVPSPLKVLQWKN